MRESTPRSRRYRPRSWWPPSALRSTAVAVTAGALALAGVMLPLGACRRLESAAEDSPPLIVEPWVQDFALGRRVDRRGLVLEDEHVRRFVAGTQVYYSMKVDAAAPEDGTIAVVWGPSRGEDAMREEARIADQDTLVFSLDTSDWPAGTYSVQAWAGDRKVDERFFTVLSV